jgi:hypothetical protein
MTSVDDLPGAVRLPAGGAIGLLLATSNDTLRGVFAAVKAVPCCIGFGRCNAIAGTGVWILPVDGLTVLGVLQGLPRAVLIYLIHVTANRFAYQDTDQGPRDGGGGTAVASAELGAG